MLRRAAPTAVAELSSIEQAPAAVVALAYPADALVGLPVGTGFVTAGEEPLVRACTWSSAKWEHLRGEPAIVKAFVGRAGAPAAAAGDRELAAAVQHELAEALGLRHAPVDLRVRRFGAAIPQYAVGHLERVSRIEAALPARIAVAGATYHGAGVAACALRGPPAPVTTRAATANTDRRRAPRNKPADKRRKGNPPDGGRVSARRGGRIRSFRSKPVRPLRRGDLPIRTIRMNRPRF
jgi:hypothetical protein